MQKLSLKNKFCWLVLWIEHFIFKKHVIAVDKNSRRYFCYFCPKGFGFCDKNE